MTCFLLGVPTGVWAAEDGHAKTCDSEWREKASSADVKDLDDDWGRLFHAFCEDDQVGSLKLAVSNNPRLKSSGYLRRKGLEASPAKLLESKPAAELKTEGEKKDAKKTGWYISFTIGLAFSGPLSNIDHTGVNKDSFCYPDDLCFGDDSSPPISGYRWSSQLKLKESGLAGPTGFFIGYAKNGIRIDLSYQMDDNELEQASAVELKKLVGAEYLPVDKNPESPVAVSVISRMGKMAVKTVGLNGYYDLPRYRKLMPYVGLGVGFGFPKVTGAHFSAKYDKRDDLETEIVFDPPLSFYNVVTDPNFSDAFLTTVMFHTGVDFDLEALVDIGLRFTFSHMEGFEDRSHYYIHPMNSYVQSDPLSFTDTFGRTRKWRLDFVATWK